MGRHSNVVVAEETDGTTTPTSITAKSTSGKWWTRRRIVIAAAFALLACAIVIAVPIGVVFGRRQAHAGDNDNVDVDTSAPAYRANAVKEAFDFAWNGYSQYCMGHDALYPVTNTCNDNLGGWGVTAIDALSTAIVMENANITLQILKFIAYDLDLTQVFGGTQVEFFEVVIRHLGGMISAYDLLTGPFVTLVKDDVLVRALRDKMVQLGDILAFAFNSESGIPHAWVGPDGSTDDGDDATLSGIGSCVLEFTRLSNITGNDTYAQFAQKAESYALNPQPLATEAFPGLLADNIGISLGYFQNGAGSWGSASDSFYEYLLKMYIYDSSKYQQYFDRWSLAADSTLQRLKSSPYAPTNFTFVARWEYDRIFHDMEALCWFAGGNFILGGLVSDNQTLIDFGLALADTVGHIYNVTKTGLGPEWISWTPDCGSDWEFHPCNANNTIKITNAEYALRPEAIETWYYSYRATGDVKYRDYAWNAFIALNTTCRTESAFSAIADVNSENGGWKTDVQDSFLYAEVLKYLYLIFLDDPAATYQVQNSRAGTLNTWVFNTEAHPLKIAGPPI